MLRSRLLRFVPFFTLAPLALAQTGLRLTPPGALPVERFEWVESTRRLVYTDADGLLHALPFPAALQQEPLTLSAQRVREWSVTPDGARVLYRVTDGGTTDLFSASLVDGTHVRLNEPLVHLLRTVAEDYACTADGAWVVYRAPQDSDVHELFAVPADRSAPPHKLNAPLPAGRDVERFRVAPAGLRVAFTASTGAGVYADLQSVPADGSDLPVELNPGADDYYGSSFQFSPDGGRVAFVLNNTLFSVPSDASALPVLLGPRRNGILRFDFTRDSSRVLFVNQTVTSYELFVIPSDASGPMLTLSETITPDVFHAEFTPAGDRVVFSVTVNGGEHLYSAPSDDSSPPVRLDGCVLTGQAAAGVLSDRPFQIAADGTRVVYRADQEVDEQFELYSAPIDGSAASLRLNGTLTGVRDVFDFRLSPDGRSVAYRSNQELATRLDLFHVPLGGGPLVKVDAELVLDGHVGRLRTGGLGLPIVEGDYFTFTAGGALVYLADQEVDEDHQLYVTLLGRPPRASTSPAPTRTVSRTP